MSTMKDVAINGYKTSYDDFLKEYSRFNRDNVTKTGPLNFDVTTQEPTELYLKLQSVIHWAVIISNTVIYDQISETDNDFMDAFRHVDNIIKHEQNSDNIEIADLISSTPKIAGNILKVTKQPVFQASMELVSIWEDLSTIPCKPKYQKQRDAYNMHLKNELVIKTIDKLDSVIEKYII